MMTPDERAFMQSALAKLTTAPLTITEDERAVLQLYGSDRDAAILLKAITATVAPLEGHGPPPAPKPAARVVTERDLEQTLEMVADSVGKVLKTIVDQQNARLAEVTTDLRDLRERVRAQDARTLELEADKAAREIPTS